MHSSPTSGLKLAGPLADNLLDDKLTALDKSKLSMAWLLQVHCVHDSSYADPVILLE